MIAAMPRNGEEDTPEDPRRRALERVLASRKFSQSNRLSTFLQYVTEKAIAGKPEEATEQPIGIHVFGRTPGFNPAEDNVVRSTARQLRERLALYYLEEGAGDEFRIVMAPGGYVPRFEPQARASAVPDAAAPAAVIQPPAWSNWRRVRTVLIGLAVLIVLAVAGYKLNRPRMNPLWHALFESGRPLILVAGDSGTVMRQNLTGTVVHVKDYAARAFPPGVPPRNLDEAVLQDIGGRRYTSYSDLRFAVRLAMVPHLPRERFAVRYARDFGVEDLKGANVILVGAPQGNPWVEMFEKDLNFRIVSDEVRRTLTVENRHPKAGEQAVYTYSATSDNRRAYALLSLTRNLDDTGYVLLAQGTTVAGIEAATDFLFNDTAMEPILRQASAPGGVLRGFEILLEAAFVAGSGGRAEVRATRVGR